MQTIIIRLEENKVSKIKKYLQDMKIAFEVKEESPYNPEFVAKIKRSKQDFKDGKGVKISIEQYNKELEESIAQIEKGECYSQKEMKQRIELWSKK